MRLNSIGNRGGIISGCEKNATRLEPGNRGGREGGRKRGRAKEGSAPRMEPKRRECVQRRRELEWPAVRRRVWTFVRDHRL